MPSDNAVNNDQNAGQTNEKGDVDDPIFFGISLFLIGVVHPIQNGMGMSRIVRVHFLKKAHLFWTEMVGGFAKTTHADILTSRVKRNFPIAMSIFPLSSYIRPKT